MVLVKHAMLPVLYTLFGSPSAQLLGLLRKVCLMPAMQFSAARFGIFHNVQLKPFSDHFRPPKRRANFPAATQATLELSTPGCGDIFKLYRAHLGRPYR